MHTPTLRLAGEPKSQKRPLCGSQGSRSVHSSPSCLAHTRQQPQPSSTRLTPAGQRGAGAVHWHWPLQSWPAVGCKEEGAVSRAHTAAGPSYSRRSPSPLAPVQLGSPCAYPAAEGEQEHEGETDGTQAGGGHGRGAADRGS